MKLEDIKVGESILLVQSRNEFQITKLSSLIFYWESLHHKDLGDSSVGVCTAKELEKALTEYEGKVVDWFEGETMNAGASVTSKFKAGDKVRCVDTSFGRAFIKGNTYTVREDCTKGSLRIERDEGGIPNGWSIDKFELVESNLDPTPIYSLRDNFCKCSFVGFGHDNDCAYVTYPKG